MFDWGYFPEGPDCFPPELLEAIYAKAGIAGSLGNCHASGTEIIKRFDNHFKYDEIDDDYYATEDSDAPHFRRILHWYRDHFGSSPTGASILLPIGALRALRRLTAFSDGRCIVISGDKGNNNPEQFRGLMDPHIA